MNSMQKENKKAFMGNLVNPHQLHTGQMNRLQQKKKLHNQQQEMGQQNQLRLQMGQLNQSQLQNQQQEQLLQQNQKQMQMLHLHCQVSQQNQLRQQIWRQNQLQLQMGQQNQLQQQMRQLSPVQNLQQMSQQIRLQPQEHHNYLKQHQMRQKNSLQVTQQSQVQQQRMGKLDDGNLSQSGLIEQRRHLQMFSGESVVDSAVTYNLHNEFLTSPRESAGFFRGSQFDPSNFPRQSLPGMQTMGATGSPNFSNSFGCTQQMMAPVQLRQQLSYQNALASGQTQKISMNDQVSGLSKNGQLGMIQNSRPQQKGLLQMPEMTSAYSSQQQQMFLQQEIASTRWLQNSEELPQMDCLQLHQQQAQGQALPQQLPHQLQIHRETVPGDQRCLNSTGSRPHTSTYGVTTLGGSLSQDREASNQLLGRRTIQDLVDQMGLNGSLDPELENLFLGIADNFIESVTAFSGDLAKRRNSSTLEAKDVLLHLEKNWNLALPGYSSEERE